MKIPDPRYGELHYGYVVITETPADRNPTRARQLFDETYMRAQILVCDMTGGIPIEVGTGVKPGKLNFLYEKFDLLNEAIEFSHAVADRTVDHSNEREKNTWQGGKRRTKKFRHKA